jgi:hypothetical protein
MVKYGLSKLNEIKMKNKKYIHIYIYKYKFNLKLNGQFIKKYSYINITHIYIQRICSFYIS